MPKFISGLDLSRRFFRDVIHPLLAAAFPALRYAAALLGPGSEVLGFDTEMSIDHDWGPRLFLFLREEDAKQRDVIGSLLSQQLYEILARMQNALGLCRTLPATVSPFYDRPFSVIHGEPFAQALVEPITDPAVQRIAKWQLIGNINQWSDNTDMEGVERGKLRQLYP